MTDSRKQHDFVIWKNSNESKTWFWWTYYDGNYEPLAHSETYTTLSGAQRGLANFKSEMKLH